MDAEVLRKQLREDNSGEGHSKAVLEKALASALSQLLTDNSRDRIIQHYLRYAIAKNIVPTGTQRANLRRNKI